MSDMKTKKAGVGGRNQQVSSPTFKKIVSDVDSGKITLKQAINKIVPTGTPQNVKQMLARAIGTQSGRNTVADIDQKVRSRRSKKTQTRKPSK